MQDDSIGSTMYKNRLLPPIFCSMVVLSTTPVLAQMGIRLNESELINVRVGDRVTLTASPDGEVTSEVWYRFRARELGEPFRVIRDFGPLDSLNWTAADHEGGYEIEVAARNQETGERAVRVEYVDVVPRVTSTEPVVNATDHPLVFLYSAPPCEGGSTMQVAFQAPRRAVHQTPAKPCVPGRTMNFYIAGLRPDTGYSAWHVIETGDQRQQSTGTAFTTPVVDQPLPSVFASMPQTSLSAEGMMLFSLIGSTPFATDLDGNLVWFYQGYATLTRAAGNGLFLGIVEMESLGAAYQAVREFDIAGYTIRETNAARVNEQLAAMGRRPISGFHHEAVRLPDGKLMALASVEQILEGVQGDGPVDILGDAIIILNADLEVVWAWDAFDHLDPRNAAILDEKCSPGQGGCPPLYLAETANDWLHSNSLQYTPDGNILMSIRHLDWLIKIDYRDGLGTGDILWRLGRHGDFTMISDDPMPWFSHQHDGGFVPGDNSTLVVFDNGNTRARAIPSSHSRGQAIQLDEATRTARLVLNADLGALSAALGSAQKLSNGNYHFNLGFLRGLATSVEVNPAGSPVFSLNLDTLAYRTFRLRDLYQPF